MNDTGCFRFEVIHRKPHQTDLWIVINYGVIVA